jgi:hypothetical protein
MSRARGRSRRVAHFGRLGLLATAIVSAVLVQPTALGMSVVLLIGSLVISSFARPLLDAMVVGLFLIHAVGTLLGPANIRAWGPVLHLTVPILVALVLAFGYADRRLPPRAIPLRWAPLTSALGMALLGSLAVVVGWEMLERLLILLPGVEIQIDRGDTKTDLQLGALGTVLGLAVAWMRLRSPQEAGTITPGRGRPSGPRRGQAHG